MPVTPGFIEYRIHGFEEITRLLQLMKRDIREKVMRKAMRAGAVAIAKQARANAKQKVNETGSTMAGISAIALKAKAGRPDVTAKVGVRSGRNARVRGGKNKGALRKGMQRDPFYWWYHELGTKKMEARPFMGPAIRTAADEALVQIRNVAGRELVLLVHKHGGLD